MGYQKEAIKGVSWIGAHRILTKVFGLVEAILLARILAPEQFGAYGVALLALGLLEVITESGVNIVLLQEDDIDRHLNSAWIVSILRGVLIMLIIFLGAPLISDFFQSSESLILLYTISLVPLIRGFINPAIVKFQKNLMFARDFWYRITVIIIDTIASIFFTYITNSPIGIVIGLLLGVVLELVLSFLIIKPRPRIEIEKKYINKIFDRGKWVTFSTIFDYLFHNADNIFVGRILGAGALGIYQMAYALSAGPIIEVGRVFVHVIVPIMIKIADDSRRLKSVFFKSIFGIAGLTFPFALVFAVLPDLFVFLLGEKWSDIATVLPILGLVGFVKSVSLASNALFLSLKKQEYTTVITLINILGLSVSIVPLITSYGIFGAGLSALIGTLASLPIITFYTYKIFVKKSL